MEHDIRAAELFLEGYNCAQAVAVAFCDVTGLEPQFAAKMASSFGGGMGRMREVCGAVSGMLMVLGLLYGYDTAGDDESKKEQYHLIQQMAEQFGLENDIRVSTLSRYPEVFSMEEVQVDEEELWNLLEKALKGACEQFVETRIKEGENLKRDLLAKLDEMLENVEYISVRSPEIVGEYRRKLEDKVRELLDDVHIEESRLATEITIFADKICVDEEIVRLRSHIEHTKATLEEGGAVGRKLDFIAQEMNREANTILSKANDLEVSNHAIDLKTEIEKVREQIQNIE